MNRPILHERALEQALEAMRTGQGLRDHVLFSFLCVRLRLRDPDSLTGQAALQIALFDLLTAAILDKLSRLRALCSLPAPDLSGADPHIPDDFSHSNQELEAWSLLYARYVCVDRALSMADLADLTGMPERTLRRRVDRGIRRLMFQLIRVEQDARHRERQLRLRLSLPQSHPPALVGVNALLPMVVHLIEDSDPPRHVLLHGPPGIGKTALALAAAHILVEKRTLDDVVWLPLAGRSASAEAVLNEMAVYLGLAADDYATLVQSLRAYLLLHRTLFILDGAEGMLNVFEPLLTTLDAAQVLITSRVELPPDVWCSQVTVPELTRDHALELAENVVQTVRRQDGVADQFDMIWPVVGGNPLALKLAFGLVRHGPSAALQMLYAADQPLGIALESIWAGLSTSERKLLLIACLFHPVGLSGALFQVLLDLTSEQIARLLTALNRCSLLDLQTGPVDSVTYHLPSMLASYLTNIIRAGRDLGNGLSSHHMVVEAFRRYKSFLLEQPNPFFALQVIRAARQYDLPASERLNLMSSLACQITEARLWQPWNEELRALAGGDLSTSQKLWCDHHLGAALRWMGHYAEAGALFESVLIRSSPFEPQYAEALIEISVVRRYQGAWDDAFQLAQAAHEIVLRNEDGEKIQRCVRELAQIAVDVQDPARALAWLSRLVHWDARAWGVASQAYTSLGEHEDAIAAAHHALDLLPEQHPDRGRGMVRVANAYIAGHQLQLAVDYLTAALDHLDRVRDMIGYARGANNLVAVLLFQPVQERRLTRAQLHHLLIEALEVQQRTGDELGVAITRQNLARLEVENQGRAWYDAI